jgi:hypothetical protein
MLTDILNDLTWLECWKCKQTFSWQKCIIILGHYELFPDETIPNVKIKNRDWRQNPKHKKLNYCIIQDRMPIEPLTQQQSLVRGNASSPFPSLARGAEKGFSPLLKLSWGRAEGLFPLPRLSCFLPSPSLAVS